MRIDLNKTKNTLLYVAMPTAAAFIVTKTVPEMMVNPASSLLFIPMYALIADTYKKTLLRFGGVK